MKSRRFYNLADAIATAAIAVGILSAAGLFLLGVVTFVGGLV